MSFSLRCNRSLLSTWTWEEDKAFESALAFYSGDFYPWEKIAAAVPGRNVEEIKDRFALLYVDVNAIDSGKVPFPQYADTLEIPGECADCAAFDGNMNHSGEEQSESSQRKKSSQLHEQRKRGVPWTLEEHRLFLQGLEMCGRGAWKNVSRYFVLSRTPTQVASHAQKYFQRMSMVNKARKRSSIHDITILGDGKLSIQQIGTTEQGAGGGFTVDTQSIGDQHCKLLSQGSGSNQIMRAADSISCAPMITSQDNASALQVPFGEQMSVATAEVGFSNTLITRQPGMSTPQGPISRDMPGTAEGRFDFDFEDSASPFDLGFGLYGPSATIDPRYGSFVSNSSVDMDNLTFPTTPSDKN